MPCHIQHDGPAPVSAFFRPQIVLVNTVPLPQLENYSAAFRGRELFGIKVPLPEGFTGVILEEDHASDSDDTDHDFLDEDPFGEEDQSADSSSFNHQRNPKKMRTLHITKTFYNFITWQREMPPSADSVPLQWVNDWMPLYSVLHAPVTLEQVNSVDLSALALLEADQ